MGEEDWSDGQQSIFGGRASGQARFGVDPGEHEPEYLEGGSDCFIDDRDERMDPGEQDRLFDPEIGAYRSGPPTKSVLDDIWSELPESSFDQDSVLRAVNDDDLRRIQKPINAERIEMLLSRLRDSIIDDTTQEFIRDHAGIVEYLADDMGIFAGEWENPESQSRLGEHL